MTCLWRYLKIFILFIDFNCNFFENFNYKSSKSCKNGNLGQTLNFYNFENINALKIGENCDLILVLQAL